MADTSQHQEEVTEPPQTNGVLDDGLTEEERSKMRPADIDADMKEMERRKRVEMMMNSRLFREELERIIESQMKDGSGPSGLLQQISEMMGHQGARFNTSVFKNSNCVVPINDIRGVESMGYAKGEKLLRCKLAAVFRLLDLYGWTQGVGGMITARLNQDQEHFLVNPYGLLYHEVTASSLVKADMQGGVVEQGTTNFGVHIAGYQLHSTIHAARPDIKCIVHIATPSVTAVSSTKCGILPLGQESIVIGEVSAHHYVSAGPLDPDEREKLARNFGPINKVMLLTNRGALCCGETVEEAFFNVYNTVLACETQLKLMPLGVDNLTLITDEARKAIYEASRKAPVPQSSSVAEPSPLAEKLEKRWRIGGTEFEALMRMLDNAGFRTGYIYRHPLVKSEPPRPRNDVEVPPAVSSLGYLLEEEELYKQGLWKGGRKGNDRTRWLNSPNVYQKVEILETGTPDPKKITKWVSDGSPTHSSTPVKIDGALQFVPKNTNPKEFKQLQQQIKDYRRADKISAGPQSHILEGVTWEEAKKMQDATISGTGEQVVLVGAASKGIIQRGFQHNAMVYKTPYAKNPFDAVTDQELDQYKKEIERKTKGDIYDESQSESEALSSFNISRATHESSTAKSPIQSPVSVTSETEEESRDEPKVLRIETKQVPAPSQPEVVLSDGVSGVTRLSSRSTSSIDECWSSLDNYDDCVLETTRAQELPRPMKPLMTNVQNCFTVKHKTKHNFSDNCENRVKNNIQTGSNCKSQDSDVTRNLENAAIKLERYNLQLIAEKYKQRHRSRKWQKQSSTETETTNIQYTKGADLDFAEKVILPVECSVKEHKINHVNGNDAKTIQHIAELTKNNVEKAANLYNIKLDVLTDNRSNNDENQGKALQPQKELSKNLESLEENRNIDIYVNEVELAESYGKVEGTTQQSQRELSNNFESSEQNGNIDIYVNEVQFPESYGKIKENTLQYRKGLTTKLESLDDNRNTGIYVNKLQENIGQRGFVPNNGVNKLDNNNTIYESGCILSSLENSFNSTLISSDSETNNNMKNSKLLSVCHNASLENVPDVDDKTVHSRSLEHSLETPVDLSKYGLSSQLQNFEDNTISSCAEEEIISSQNQTLDIKSSIKERYENESSVLDHSTPLENNTIEKNSIGTRMNEHVESRRRLLMNNTENRENFHFTLNQRKLGKRDDSWTIDRSQTNFFDDETRQFTNLSIPDKQNLDFTFSDSERSTEDLSAASTPRTSFCIDDESGSERISRDDSIGEVVCSIDANIKPSTRHLIDHLADTENSSKYNLDSQNMNLIYSLTPPNDIGDSSRNTTLEDNFEDYEDKRHDKDDADNEYYEDDENAIQINLSNTNRQETSVCKIIELSDMTFHSIISNSGSDLLDLPKDTYQDFQKSSEETFHKNISTSADQVINELDLAEIQISAANFVDEMIFDIYCLNLSRDLSSRFSNKKELTNFIKDKTSALVFVRRLARDLVNHLPYSEVSTTSHTKEKIPSTATTPMRTTARFRTVAKRM